MITRSDGQRDSGGWIPALIGLVLLLGASAGAQATDAGTNPTLLFFFQEDCSSCHAVSDLLETLSGELPEEQIARHNIEDEASFRLLERLADAFELEDYSAPVVFVGDHAIVGSGRGPDQLITDAIVDCYRQGCESPLLRVQPKPVPWGEILRLVAFAALAALLVILQPL